MVLSMIIVVANVIRIILVPIVLFDHVPMYHVFTVHSIQIVHVFVIQNMKENHVIALFVPIHVFMVNYNLIVLVNVILLIKDSHVIKKFVILINVAYEVYRMQIVIVNVVWDGKVRLVQYENVAKQHV